MVLRVGSSMVEHPALQLGGGGSNPTPTLTLLQEVQP
jgi:hypothetical protein